MPSTRDLRRRIKSVKNTAQITKAMQMVSATKMRKAQNQALQARPYTQTFLSVLSSLSGKIVPDLHPLLSNNGSNKVAILILSSDKGLCGALNTNLFRFLQNSELFSGKEIMFYSMGKKGRDFLVRVGKDLQADFESQEHISFRSAIKIRNFVTYAFSQGEIGGAYLLYPHFISTLRQEPKLVKILPIDKDAIWDVVKQPAQDETASLSAHGANGNGFLFEPNPDQVLDFALTHLLDTQIYQSLLETKASEHSARMIAMQSATDNARDLVADLQLTYNQMRQDAITKELLEITSAAAALE